MKHGVRTLILLTLAASSIASDYPPLPRQVLEALEAQRRAREHAGFDLAKLQAIPDSSIEGEVHHFLFSRIEADVPRAFETIVSLPRGFQVFYLSWLAEFMIVRQGFEAYFRQPNIPFVPLTPAALSELGDPLAAELLQQAIAAHVASESVASGSASLRPPTSLSALRSRFVERARRFPELRVAYIRRNPTLFVTR